MRRWCLSRALKSAQKNANLLQHWIALKDFDGSEYGTDYLQIHKGDVLEQWQNMSDGWVFGQIIGHGPLAPKERYVVGWFPRPSIVE